MTARRHICDVPGCGLERKRWQRICDRCFGALPGDIRTGIITAHKEGRKPDWRRWKRKAGEVLAARPSRPPTHAIDPATAYANTARLLGERP